MKNIAKISAAVVLGASSVGAFANTVDINTGSAAWVTKSFEGLYIDGTQTTKSVKYAGDDIGSASHVITPNSAWIPAAQVGDGSAQWVAPSMDGASNGAFGFYTYELVIPLAELTGGSYVMSGSFSSDNYVAQIQINNQLIVPTQEGLGGHGAIWGFEKAFSVGAGGLTGPITIDVTVYNESTAGHFNMDPFHQGETLPDGPNAPLGTSNPTGMILQGELRSAAVPLPASVWGGGALLAAFGVARYVRRK